MQYNKETLLEVILLNPLVRLMRIPVVILTFSVVFLVSCFSLVVLQSLYMLPRKTTMGLHVVITEM